MVGLWEELPNQIVFEGSISLCSWKQSICNYLEPSPIACNLTHKDDLLGDSGPSWIYPTNCATEKERNQSLQQIWLVAFKVAHQTHRKLHPHRVALCCLQLYTKFGAGLSQRSNDFEPRVRGRHYLFVFQTSLFFVFFVFFLALTLLNVVYRRALKCRRETKQIYERSNTITISGGRTIRVECMRDIQMQMCQLCMHLVHARAHTITPRRPFKDKFVRRQVKISDSFIKYHFRLDCVEARRRVFSAGGSPRRPNWVLGWSRRCLFCPDYTWDSGFN